MSYFSFEYCENGDFFLSPYIVLEYLAFEFWEGGLKILTCFP